LREHAEQAVERDPMTRSSESRLIVISNRVSAPKGSTSGSQGGLAVALAAALRENGGIWFGWSGEVTDQFTGQINFQRAHGVTKATPTGRCGRCSTIASIWPNTSASLRAGINAPTSGSRTPSAR
jgi:trehalose-6-phosphate synthase